jgi:hypothetical protein
VAYVYILFYAMIKEADMRLSSDVSMCRHDKKHIFDTIIRRDQTSGHRKVGCAVGNPRLVNSALLRGETREGVVIRHNRLTEWDLTGTHGSTFEQTSPFQLLSSWGRRMRIFVRIFFRETGMLVHTSSWMRILSSVCL